MNTIGTVTGYTALALILINVSLYFLFLWIRKSKNRPLQMKLAKIARIWMKTHRPIAAIAFFILLIHSGIAINKFELYSVNVITGLAAGIIFLLLLTSGYIRNQKATGKRKKAHRLTAFIFLFFVILHVFGYG